MALLGVPELPSCARPGLVATLGVGKAFRAMGRLDVSELSSWARTGVVVMLERGRSRCATLLREAR